MRVFVAICILIMCVACTHKKEGMYVKGTDGKYYKLREGPGDEAYLLIEVDTASVDLLRKIK